MQFPKTLKTALAQWFLVGKEAGKKETSLNEATLKNIIRAEMKNVNSSMSSIHMSLATL